MSRLRYLPSCRTLTQAALCLGLLVASGASVLRASPLEVPLLEVPCPQGGATGKVRSSAPPVPTLSTIEHAGRTQDYTAEQLRRFRDESGNVVTVRERFSVDADASRAPRFSLTFLGVEGEPPGSQLQQQWQATYARFGAMFARHGSFVVRDVAGAIGNYTLHDFGPVVRAGRSARRMVVFPNTLDKAIWVVDVDLQTSVPLFAAEFDSQLRLFAEIEAVSFTPSAPAIPASSPSISVTPLPDFAAAVAHLGRPVGLVEPNVGVTSDYVLERVEVHEDPLNGREDLVMTYTDGIDQFVITQTPDAADPFDGMPSSSKGTAHTIARFRDPALTALVFWADGVEFHLAGRGSLQRLDDLAKALYLQALSAN